MKKIFTVLMLILAVTNISAKSRSRSAKLDQEDKIVIVGLEENVKSNYFVNYMIEEKTHIPEDSICAIYNKVIAEEIGKELASNNLVHYTTSADLTAQIKVTGEDENVAVDLSGVDADTYQSFLEREDSKYLLVINQHYLKWQEKPLRTLFHFVSYSLYDENRTEVSKGCNYFTSMDLLDGKSLKKRCHKTSEKIASSLLKEVAHR